MYIQTICLHHFKYYLKLFFFKYVYNFRNITNPQIQLKPIDNITQFQQPVRGVLCVESDLERVTLCNCAVY